LAQSALTLVFASVAAGLAAQGVTHVYASLATSDGSPIGDWATLIGALEAGTLKLSILNQPYWAILAVGFISIFMVRGAARMAASLTGTVADNFSGATAGVASLAAVGVRLSIGAARESVRRAPVPLATSSGGPLPSAQKGITSPRQTVALTMGRLTRHGVSSLAAQVSGLVNRRGS
jgi:hypothetical protein